MENGHQAIIPKRIHDYVQRKMNNDVTIRVSHLGGKIICAKCGEYFGRFKIHLDWYGGRWAWRCRNKYSKNNKCVMRHLYADNVHQAINVAVFEFLVHSICKISDIDGYIEKLETRAKYKKLDDGVKTNVKYAVRVYFRFLEQRKQSI